MFWVSNRAPNPRIARLSEITCFPTDPFRVRTASATAVVGGNATFRWNVMRCPGLKAVIQALKPRHPTQRLFQRAAGSLNRAGPGGVRWKTPQPTADLQDKLDERTAERDEAIEQLTATAEVLRFINCSPADLTRYS